MISTGNETSFLFWQKWLFYTSLVFALSGIAFALFGNIFFFQSYNLMLAEIFKSKERWARNAIIISFSLWALIDSGVCLYFGVYPQVYLINAFSIAIKALPIILTWNHFSLKDHFVNSSSQS